MKKQSEWKFFDFAQDQPPKKTASQSSNNSKATPTPSSLKIRKTKSISSVLSKTNSNNSQSYSSFDFHSELKPKTVADLAVHAKKIEEVKFWLENIFKTTTSGHTSFLLLSGPTGSAKTTTLNILCKELGITITEWVNPVDQDYEIVRGPNQKDTFIDFLCTESNYTSLLEVATPKKIVVVKDFPNVFVKNHEQFADILEQCYYKCRYPIVFICTELSSKKINLIFKLFPQEIIQKYQITQISFNSCAVTLLKNCLKRAHGIVSSNKDLFQVPPQNVVDAILSSSMGDIRCAVNQYYFASLLGSKDMPLESTTTPVSTSKKRKRSTKLSTIKIMAKDETLGLFHALGRILNPKRIERGDTWRLNCNLDNLIVELESQPENVVSFLFTNYIKYFGNFKDIQKAADLLCISQTFFDRFSERNDLHQYPLWISVLGLMVVNNHKVSKWNQIEGPRKIKKEILRTQQTNCSLDDFYINLLQGKS